MFENDDREDTRDMLVRGIAAAKAKSNQEARYYLQWVVKHDRASFDDQAQAWYWLGQICDDPAEKRKCLEQTLTFNPANTAARRDLALLRGDIQPDQIVNPDKLSIPSAQPPKPAEARRYVCAQCGGRMGYSPDGMSLTCAYCNRTQLLAALSDDRAILVEQDLVGALVTTKGHTVPVQMRSMSCQGCGASFVLAPEMLSWTCPYCGSAYVAERVESRDLIQPEGVAPFVVTQDKAHRAILQWYKANGWQVRTSAPLPIGVYLPAWTFDISGEIPWSCQVYNDKQWRPRSGAKVAYENDLLVAASHTLSAQLVVELNNFPLNRLVPYDPRYLADWPAETYQICVSDASLAARWRVVSKIKKTILNEIYGEYKDLTWSTSSLLVESFKLVLLPTWITHYHMKGKSYRLIVNGQNGAVRAEKPESGVWKFLASIVGEE